MEQFTLIRQEDWEMLLQKEPFMQGKRLLASIQTLGLPINILEDTDVVNDAEVHKKEGDLWFCISGTVTFVCGGEMVDPWCAKKPDGLINEDEIKAKEIRDGTNMVLKPGDILWIPSGVPHQHFCKKGTSRLAIVKIKG